MSRNHKDEIEMNTLGHFIASGPDHDEFSAPIGMEASSNARTSQGNIFDALEGISDSSCKAVAYGALSYRAGFGLIMGAHSLLKRHDFDLHKIDETDSTNPLTAGMLRNAALYNFANDEGFTYAMNKFEEPQNIAAIFESARKQNARKIGELSNEERDMLGISDTEAKELKATAERRAEHAAKFTSESLSEHEHVIKGMVTNMLSNVGNENPENRFDATQHAGLFEAVLKGLNRRRTQNIATGLQYDGDFAQQRYSDARELQTAIKVVEKVYVAFRKANMTELRYAS